MKVQTLLRKSIALVLLASCLLLAASCARGPRDPGAWKAASEKAAHEWIKTDPHLIARLGNVTDIAPGKVEWEKVKTDRVFPWREPVHIRMVSYLVDGPKGKFQVRMITQGRGDKSQVTYWAWSQGANIR